MTSSSVLKEALLVAGLVIALKGVRLSGVIATSVDDNMRAEPPAEQRNNNGGWKPPDMEAVRKLYTSRCNIKRVSVNDLDGERFEKEFRYKNPVLITFPNGAADWTVPEKWSQDYLRKNYGQRQMDIGSSLDIRRGDGRTTGNKRHSFIEFTDRLMRQTFQGSDEARSFVWDHGFYREADFSSSLRLPSYLAERDNLDDGTFYLGASGSGVSFHAHNDGRGAMVFGRKRWFVYPATKSPPGGLFPFSVMEWYAHIYPKLTEEERPLECVQEAGEIFYIPEGYYHAVINIGDTIGMALVALKCVTVVRQLLNRYWNRFSEMMKQGKSPADFTEKQIKTGVSNLRRLRRILPDNIDVMLKLAAYYNDVGGKQQEVRDLLMKVIDHDPYNVYAYCALGTVLARLNQLEEAEEFYLKARKLVPGYDLVHTEYGRFLVNTGRYDEAVHVLKTATTIAPDKETAWSLLRVAQALSGDIDGAKATTEYIK
ncbi:hypothetical protein BaRGS_00038521, partial [Batillaria attramentaria]